MPLSQSGSTPFACSLTKQTRQAVETVFSQAHVLTEIRPFVTFLTIHHAGTDVISEAVASLAVTPPVRRDRVRVVLKVAAHDAAADDSTTHPGTTAILTEVRLLLFTTSRQLPAAASICLLIPVQEVLMVLQVDCSKTAWQKWHQHAEDSLLRMMCYVPAFDLWKVLVFVTLPVSIQSIACWNVGQGSNANVQSKMCTA